MSQHYCAACRAAPATIFCSADAAFLCVPCDITIHEANKLAQRHTRLPLHLIDHANSTPSTPAPAEKTSSCETGLEESDTSSGFLTFPDHDDASLYPVSSYTINHSADKLVPPRDFSCEPVSNVDEQERLASIAGAFVKREAQTLLESSRIMAREELSQGLDATWMSGTVPFVDGHVYSSTEDDGSDNMDVGYIGSIDNFSFVQKTLSRNVQSSTTTDEDSNRPAEQTPDGHATGANCFEEVERTDEQKRMDRQAALKRFRNKRANRSFRKKVRYECRKQLADSRPRVKGRFVGRSKSASGPRIQMSGKLRSAG